MPALRPSARRPFFPAALLAALLAVPAQAQTQPAPATAAPPAAEGEEVVVTGIRDREQAIKDFVGALTPSAFNGQISRFETVVVCPAAAGVPPAQKAAIAARLRRVAKAAGIPVAGEKCVPNVIVVVTPDKRGFMEALVKRNGYLFGNRSDSEITKLIRTPGPSTAWQVGGPPVTADGTEVAYYATEGVYVNRTGRSATRAAPPVRPQFGAAMVVVDQKALDGLTVTQLADFVAMRAFANTDPARVADTKLPTILKVLDAPMGSEVPLTLTEWDLAFLRGLYAAPPAVSAPAQRSGIARQVEQALDKPKQR